MSGRTRGYAHRVDIRAQVPQVWRALTDPASLVHWCAPDARIRPNTGGSFSASVDRVSQLQAHIDVFDPERRIRLIYLPSPALPGCESAIVSDFILEPAEGGTILRVLGSGVPGDPEWDTPYKRLRMGWERAMSRLKLFLEQT
jgi:uncharacterized protein YndB with AHSA1/START domain